MMSKVWGEPSSAGWDAGKASGMEKFSTRWHWEGSKQSPVPAHTLHLHYPAGFPPRRASLPRAPTSVVTAAHSRMHKKKGLAVPEH